MHYINAQISYQWFIISYNTITTYTSMVRMNRNGICSLATATARVIATYIVILLSTIN